MAYENQSKCYRCGKSIFQPPENATYEELVCDGCYEELDAESTIILNDE